MDGAIKVENGRYRMNKDWEKVIRFYQSVYGGKPGYLWRNIASTPKVRAIHIANMSEGAKGWEGINLYETKGEVYAFVIKAESEAGSRMPGRSRERPTR